MPQGSHHGGSLTRPPFWGYQLKWRTIRIMTQDFVFPLSHGLSCELPLAFKAGDQFRQQYAAGEPFSYVQIDNFMDPAILERVLEELHSLPGVEETYSRAQENLKRSFQPDGLPTYARDLFS